MEMMDTVGELMELGISENEARAFLVLMEEHPLTGYETAKRSGIPSSKVYQVLHKLLKRGMVYELNLGGKNRYVPQDGREFIREFRHSIDARLDKLELGLSRIGKPGPVSYILNLDSYTDCMDKAVSMIRAASSTILLSLWEEEYRLIRESLDEKLDSCRVSMVFFGEAGASQPPETAACFYHPIRDTLYEEKGGRGFVLVADGREAMMGTFFPGRDASLSAEGAFSRNLGFTTLAEDYIKHDIYIMKIVDRFEGELQKRFGRNYELMRDIFSDKEIG